MIRSRKLWAKHVVFLIGFALQLYWPQSIGIFINEILQYEYCCVDRVVLLRVLSIVEGRLRGLRVTNGVLCLGSRGADPLRNPSERRSGAVRYRLLAGEVSRWAGVAHQLQVYMEQTLGSIPGLLQIVRAGQLRSYTGACDYANVRLVRCLISSAGAVTQDSVACWGCLSRMSPHIRGVVRRHGLDYEGAIDARDRLRLLLSMENYSLMDFICFLCLIRAPA